MRHATGAGLRAFARAWRQLTLPRRHRFLPDVPLGSLTHCSPDHVLLRQFVGDRCRRLDLFVRVLLLEDARTGDTDGHRLYEAYRTCRPTTTKSAAVFLGVLDDIRRHGFDIDRPITVTRDGAVTDGAHRLACAIHLDLRHVPVRLVPVEHRFYAVRAAWFLRHGFDRTDVAHLEATAERYRQRARSREHAPSAAARDGPSGVGGMSS